MSFFIGTWDRASVRVFPFFCEAKNASPLASKEKSREANRRFATCTVACVFTEYVAMSVNKRYTIFKIL